MGKAAIVTVRKGHFRFLRSHIEEIRGRFSLFKASLFKTSDSTVHLLTLKKCWLVEHWWWRVFWGVYCYFFLGGRWFQENGNEIGGGKSSSGCSRVVQVCPYRPCRFLLLLRSLPLARIWNKRSRHRFHLQGHVPQFTDSLVQPINHQPTPVTFSHPLKTLLHIVTFLRSKSSEPFLQRRHRCQENQAANDIPPRATLEVVPGLNWRARDKPKDCWKSRGFYSRIFAAVPLNRCNLLMPSSWHDLPRDKSSRANANIFRRSQTLCGFFLYTSIPHRERSISWLSLIHLSWTAIVPVHTYYFIQ